MKRRNDPRRELGFTLIELMIVIAIIGILIGAAVFSWKAATRAGNEAATIQNLKTIAAVQIQYYNTHGRTFGTFDQLVNRLSVSFCKLSCCLASSKATKHSSMISTASSAETPPLRGTTSNVRGDGRAPAFTR